MSQPQRQLRVQNPGGVPISPVTVIAGEEPATRNAQLVTN